MFLPKEVFNFCFESALFIFLRNLPTKYSMLVAKIATVGKLLLSFEKVLVYFCSSEKSMSDQVPEFNLNHKIFDDTIVATKFRDVSEQI